MWTDEHRARYDYSDRRYASDLTDAEWEKVKPLLAECVPLTVDLREMVNARLYVDWTGCQWRALPKDFGSVQHGFRVEPALPQARPVGTDFRGPAPPVGAKPKNYMDVQALNRRTATHTKGG